MCGDSIPNLCKDACSHCAHKSRSVVKCFQSCILSRQPFGPKRNKRVSRIVVDILPHGSGAFWFDSGQRQPSSSDQLRLVMDRQGALENDLMQERQARAEAERRLSVALGEVGGRADVAVVERLLPGKREFQLWMGCIDTRLLEKTWRHKNGSTVFMLTSAKTKRDLFCDQISMVI